jgi:hypothetical protein
MLPQIYKPLKARRIYGKRGSRFPNAGTQNYLKTGFSQFLILLVSASLACYFDLDFYLLRALARTIFGELNPDFSNE